MEEKGHIYFMTNGIIVVTSSLKRRIVEHSEGRGSVFTSRYNFSKIVYFEVFPTEGLAISKEEQLSISKEGENQLVETINPE